MKNLPPQMLSATIHVLHDAQKAKAIFDIYAGAIALREALPEEFVMMDELVEWMIAHLGGIEAVEFSPPGLIIDVLFCEGVSDELPELALQPALQRTPQDAQNFFAKGDALAA